MSILVAGTSTRAQGTGTGGSGNSEMRAATVLLKHYSLSQTGLALPLQAWPGSGEVCSAPAALALGPPGNLAAVLCQLPPAATSALVVTPGADRVISGGDMCHVSRNITWRHT